MPFLSDKSYSMSCSATGSQRFLAFPDIPEDHVLFSGAVVFPGCFDLQGCPLVLFPAAEQFKLNTVVKRDDLARFINYALYLHNKHQRNMCKVSVVVDLRLTALKTVRFIAETLLEIQSSTETISAMYIIQPQKKYVKKHFIKSLSKTSRRSPLTSPKCIFVNSCYELFNYIDRSQLTADFGGYLVYCHRNWALFIKEIDKFIREFFAVVSRLPSCVTELQALSLQSLPAATNLEEFFFKNEDKCSKLRRELGLDDLLIHCEHIVEKLKFPDRDPCFQSMAGTVLFSHVAFEMIENYDRITLAVEKLELLWQLVLCRIQIPLKNFQHKSEVEQIMEHITKFTLEKVNVYKVLIASDKKEAEIIKTEFEESVYLPAMELIHYAEEVLLQHAHLKRLAEGDFAGLEDSCCDSLKAIKERFHMAVDLPYSTLKAVYDFHTLLNKVKHWLSLVFNQDFFQDLIRNSYSLRLGSPACSICLSSVWQQEVQSFLRRSSVPAVEELVNLANIANNIPDLSMQLTGKELSHQYSAEFEYLFSEWEQKEKDHLQSVERLLVQASQILDEEENVLEQEEMLDFLVKTQSTGKHWEIWNESYIGGEETNQVPLSTSDFLQNGVLLLDSPSTTNDLDTVSCSSHSSALKANCSSSDNKFQEEKNEPSYGKVNNICTPSNIPSVLKELKELYVIERKILEENVKIHELQHLEKCNQIDVQCSKEMVQNMRKQRALFFMDLEKEQGVENLEKHLAKESKLTHKMPSMPCDFNRSSICNKYCEGTIADLESTKLAIHSSLCEAVGTSSSISQRSCRSSLALTDSTVTLDQDPLESAVAALNHESCVVHDQNSNLNCEWTKPEEMQSNHTVSLVDAERLSEVSSFTEESRMICMQESPTKVPCNLLKNINKNDAFWNMENKCNLKPSGTSPLPFSFERQHAWVSDPRDMEVLSPVPKPRKLSPPCKNEPNGNLKDVCNAGEKKESCVFLNELASKQSPKPTERIQVVPENPDFELLTERSPTQRLLPPLKSCDLNDVCEAFRTVFVDESNAKILQKPYHCSVQSIQCSFSENCDALSPARNDKMEHITSVEVSDFGIDVAVGKTFAKRCDASQFPLGFVRKYEEDRLPTIGTIFDHCLIKVDDFNTPIVLDTGSGLVKAGFAGQDRPAIVFPSVIGKPKYEEVMNGTMERETYIGHDAQHMRGVLTLKYPVQNGVIKNWNDIENIWQHTFHQLGVNTEDHPVLLTEAAMNPSENRRRMVEIMFESFNVPFTYVAVQAVLALYGTGRTTGVVFDSGDGVSHSVPVYEGYSIPYATQRFNLAGQDITQNLKKLLQERGFSFRTTAEQEIVREIKEACCYVAQDYEAELEEDERSAGTEMYYTLPDGQIISINKERFRAPEILFKPELIGRDHYGIHESIFRSILRCDVDLRQSFVNNIILSGGNTLFPGLPHRLQGEIQSMVPSCLSDFVRVSSPKDRDFAVWIGGAVLANLPSFRSAWISREEYEENGANIVFRKCF
ncbi:uncharacterized protein LOC114648438 isoform X2 [Erpetoichthys calabaricus]|uniref:uncharacterized protein LOC114648438 isoform X2 n=1 Tax=Erpetoichthys calabaricus TaxID=27687 RepID=UPI002234EA44|nr:uncharacterized protein LOC114648438 isoform X2 [Erpetoichthys calabaricus]